MYRRSFADTPPLRLAAAGTGGVLRSMAVFGGVNVIRGVYAARINFGGHGGVLGGHGVGRGGATRIRPHTRRSLAECTISPILSIILTSVKIKNFVFLYHVKHY